jgi:hypothetical protein
MGASVTGRGRGADGAADGGARYPATPDGRYFVVRGRLWRCSNPSLAPEERERLVRRLMRARADVGLALRSGDGALLERARGRVHSAKVALGERGPVWWTDGAPDENRRMVRNTAYAAWYKRRYERATRR